MPAIGSEWFIAGDLHVNVGRQRITRDGIEIPLPNLSFQLLLALIRAAPNILSVELLMARVWPGLIVSPETMAKRVNLLREALGDDAQDPHYIAGVRGRGYRLVAARAAKTQACRLLCHAQLRQPDRPGLRRRNKAAAKRTRS
jgi:DNA-binding winged helix-turn-helix (wHTH) protein